MLRQHDLCIAAQGHADAENALESRIWRPLVSPMHVNKPLRQQANLPPIAAGLSGCLLGLCLLNFM